MTKGHEATLPGTTNAHYLDCGTRFTGVYTCDPVLHFNYMWFIALQFRKVQIKLSKMDYIEEAMVMGLTLLFLYI